MKYYAFESTYGYNNTIRLGKIHKFTSPDTLKYILEVNVDLIELSYRFRIFSKHVKYFLKVRKIRKRFKIEYIHLVELGLATWRQLLYYDF